MSEENQTNARLEAALVAAQKAMKPVGKSSRNDFHKYNYASAEDMIAAARTALNENGLSLRAEAHTILSRDTMRVEKNYSTKEVSYAEHKLMVLHVRYLLGHESGETVSIGSETPIVPEPGKPEDKSTSAAKTLDLEYVLRSLLLIPRVPEDQVHGRDDRPEAPPPPPKKPEPKKPEAKPEFTPEQILSARAQVNAEIKSAQERGVTDTEIGDTCKAFYRGHGGKTKVMDSPPMLGELLIQLGDLGQKTQDPETAWSGKGEA